MLLYTSIFSILVSLILTTSNWRINRNTGLLGLAFLTIALYGITHHFTAVEPSSTGLIILYNHFTPLYFLTGPLVFFYVRGTFRDKPSLSRSDALHFLPALIQLIGILPWIFMPLADKRNLIQSIIVDLNQMKELNTNMFCRPAVATGIRNVHLMAYLIASGVMWWRFSTQKKSVPARQLMFSYSWIAILLISLFMLDVLLMLFTWDSMNKDIRESFLFSRSLQLISGFFYAALPSSLLFFPQILYGMPALQITHSKPASASRTPEPADPAKPSMEDQGPGDEPFQLLAQQIKEHMEKNKPFTRADYRIDDLALELQVPLNHIAYCLSIVMKQKFTALRTAYRVEYSKTLLRAGQLEKYTIEGIALKAGFGSRSNFYSAFREVTGMSPSEFMEQQDPTGETQMNR